MQELTREWIAKAENDFAAADMTLHSGDVPIIDVASFHCQQCVEKYPKAFLQEKEIEFPRQHYLICAYTTVNLAEDAFSAAKRVRKFIRKKLEQK